MATNLFADGDRTELTSPYAVTAGQGMLVGTLFGVALFSVATSTQVAVAHVGIWDITKEPSLAISAGARVFWDNTNRRVTTTATSNVCIGHATVAALAADTTVRVRLAGSTPAGT